VLLQRGSREVGLREGRREGEDRDADGDGDEGDDGACHLA